MPGRKRFFALVTLFLTYFVAARIGLGIATVNTFAALIWPPTGIAVAALLLYGEDLWPAILVGAFVVNLSIGAAPLAAVGIGIGNALEAYCTARVLRHFGFSGSFGNIGIALTFIASAILAPVISASIGVGSLSSSGAVAAAALWPTWTAWWSGDVLGMLIVAPLLITWLGKQHSRLFPISHFETFCIALFTIVVDFFIFWNTYKTPTTPPYLYGIIIPFFWATLRLGPRGKSSVLTITAIIAVAGAITGVGPFAQTDIVAGLTSLQFFLATIAITFLVFASTIEERARARSEIENYAHKLEIALQEMRLGKDPREIPESKLASD